MKRSIDDSHALISRFALFLSYQGTSVGFVILPVNSIVPLIRSRIAYQKGLFNAMFRGSGGSTGTLVTPTDTAVAAAAPGAILVYLDTCLLHDGGNLDIAGVIH